MEQMPPARSEDAGKLNSSYKSSVFAKLFSDRNRLLELYNALKNANYGPETEITVNTLRDVLFMDRVNDLSFTIENRVVVLIEHQASINRNMPLRFLLYIARIYEKIIDDRAMYKVGRQKIAKPEFIVLYNGRRPMAEQEEVRLSDAFIGLSEGESPELELKVKVYNVNRGHNEALVRRSRELSDYVEFVARVRDNEKVSLPRREAVLAAINECMTRGILEGFLREHSSEVVNMLLSEWKLEEAQQVWREEGMELGREEGIERGIEQGIERGHIEDARAMFAEGDSLDKISRVTRIPVDRLKEILPPQ